MRWIGWLVQLVLGILLLMPPEPSSAAEEVVVFGRALDERGAPVRKVIIKSASEETTPWEYVADTTSTGHFKFGINSAKADTIHCIISAEGFNAANATAVVRGSEAQMGTVRLKRYVELGPFTLLTTTDSKVYVDFVLTSRVPTLRIDRLIVTAEDTNERPCFLNPPGMTFSIERIFLDPLGQRQGQDRHLQAILAVRGDTDHVEPRFVVKGTFRSDQCGRGIVRIVAPYSVTTTSQDKDQPRRIRIVVPSTFTIRDVGVIRPNWAEASFQLQTERGDLITTTAGNP